MLERECVFVRVCVCVFVVVREIVCENVCEGGCVREGLFERVCV